MRGQSAAGVATLGLGAGRWVVRLAGEEHPASVNAATESTAAPFTQVCTDLMLAAPTRGIAPSRVQAAFVPCADGAAADEPWYTASQFPLEGCVADAGPVPKVP